MSSCCRVLPFFGNVHSFWMAYSYATTGAVVCTVTSTRTVEPLLASPWRVVEPDGGPALTSAATIRTSRSAATAADSLFIGVLPSRWPPSLTDVRTRGFAVAQLPLQRRGARVDRVGLPDGVVDALHPG